MEPGAAVLPEGWEGRLVVVRNPNTRDAEGLCLEVHDLALSKYVAAREKDRDFLRVAARHQLTTRETLLLRLAATPVDDARRNYIRTLIDSDFSDPVTGGGWPS